MKRMILVIALITAAAAAYAGTAQLSPSFLATNAYHPVLNVYYSPGTGSIYTGGHVSLQIPPIFNAAPSTPTTDAGALSAKILLNGLTWTAVPIDPSNIAINNFAVTITVASMNPADVLQITYGGTSNGIYVMATPGAYPFNVFEDQAGTGTFTPIGKQPILYITNISAAKSCSAPAIMAGVTFTYTITCHNSDANSMTGLSIWDTMPPGISFVSSVPAPSSNSGGEYAWNMGTIIQNNTNSITITARGNTGVASYGLTSVNTASISALSSLSVNNSMSFSSYTDVKGIIMQPSIAAMPDVVVSGGNITVIMSIANAGNTTAANVMPSAMTPVPVGNGNAVLASGPVPASVPLLSGNASAYFTWIFHATTAGTLNFSSHAYSDENGQAYMTAYVSSNNVTVVMPTPTSTSTSTNIPAPTATNTSVMPAATNTPVMVPTNTQVVIVPTSTKVVTPPTQTPVVIPTSVAGGNVFTDKNYMKQDTGDRIRIYYEAPAAGKLEITVFNLNGEKIRYMAKAYDAKSADYMDWDGKNDALKPVGKGIYFVNVKMGKWQRMKKVVILK